MKLQSNSNCHVCNTASSGTFLHMFWECPIVISLWTHVNLVLSSLLRIDWFANPSLCLLNDDSGLCISSMQKRMLFAGFTAAKKTIIQNWFTPHMCGKTYWIHSLLQIVWMCNVNVQRCESVGPGLRPLKLASVFCLIYVIVWRSDFCVFVVLPSLPPFWLDFEMLSKCLLFCFVIFWMLCCYVWKKIKCW